MRSASAGLCAEQVHDGQQRVEEAHGQDEGDEHGAQVHEDGAARHQREEEEARRMDVLANNHFLEPQLAERRRRHMPAHQMTGRDQAVSKMRPWRRVGRGSRCARPARG